MEDKSKNVDSSTTAQTDANTVLAAVAYQCCPVCNGTGKTVADGFTSIVYQTCKVCNGAMIIPMHIVDWRFIKHDPLAKGDYKGKIHPCQKPVTIYRWILQQYAKEGMKILDTHGGSMTIAKACDMEKFDLDICEIDEGYYNNAIKKFNEYKSQTQLF